jgi:hypothetical protein
MSLAWILIALASWLVLSVPLAVLLGRCIARGQRRPVAPVLREAGATQEKMAA